MKDRPDIQEFHQLTAADILNEIGLDREHGEFLQHKAQQDVDGEIIEDEAAEDRNDILRREKLVKEMLEGNTHEECDGREIEEEKAHEYLGCQAFSCPPASPEAFPLVRE